MRLLNDGCFFAPRSWQAQCRREPTTTALQMAPRHHIFERGHVVENLQVLKCARETQRGDLVQAQVVDGLSLEQDVSARQAMHPRDEVEGGCLARAIRSDEPQNLAVLHVKRNIVDGDEPAEFFADGLDL